MADESKPPHDPSDRSDATAMFFDRLDAAFAKLNAPRRTASPVAAASQIDSAGALPAAAPPMSAPAAAPPSGAAQGGLIADAFAALLALEDGEPGAKPVRLTTAASEPQPAPPLEIPDAIIEDIVRRVVARLGPDAVRGVVAEIVSDISERLVREEIDRIRNLHV